MTDTVTAFIITRLIKYYQDVLSLHQAGRVNGDYLQGVRDALDNATGGLDRDPAQTVAEIVDLLARGRMT